MKNLFRFIALCLLSSCTTTQKAIDINKLDKEQIIHNGPSASGEPGKCYSKLMSTNGDLNWYETICTASKLQISEIQKGLTKLGFMIEDIEIERKRFGKTTRQAMVHFQKDNGLAYGGWDEATLYLIIKMAREKRL